MSLKKRTHTRFFEPCMITQSKPVAGFFFFNDIKQIIEYLNTSKFPPSPYRRERRHIPYQNPLSHLPPPLPSPPPPPPPPTTTLPQNHPRKHPNNINNRSRVQINTRAASGNVVPAVPAPAAFVRDVAVAAARHIFYIGLGYWDWGAVV